jgi:hypothetical protein
VSPLERPFLFESGDRPRTFSLRLWLPKKKWGSVAFIEEDFLKKVPLKLPSKTLYRQVKFSPAFFKTKQNQSSSQKVFTCALEFPRKALDSAGDVW